MCCRSTVRPYDHETAVAILTIGQFEVDAAGSWSRRIDEEGVIVRAHKVADALELSLTPAISRYDHHEGKRIAGAVMFEIAARYAEKVGGTIVQQANVSGCSDVGISSHLIGSYPEMPLSYDNLCNGFRAVFLGEGND